MLPDIQSQHRLTLEVADIHEGIVLIRSGADFQLTITPDEPCPARAEASHRGCGELLLKCLEASEGLIYRFCQLAHRLTGAFRREEGPEEAMIPVPAAIIAHCGAYILRKLRNTAQNLLEGLSSPIGVLLQSRFQVGKIRAVVLLMVDFHGHLINVRLERIVGIRQVRQDELHAAKVIQTLRARRHLCRVRFGPVRVIAPGSPWHCETVFLEVGESSLLDIIPARGEALAEVSPGWVDLHSWSGQPHFSTAESLYALGRRAQRGGFTHVLIGGWQGWTDPAILSLLRTESAEAPVSFHFLASWADEKGDIAPLESLRAEGAAGWSLPPEQPIPWRTLSQALPYLRYLGGPVFVLPFWEGAAGEKGVPEAPELALAGWEGIPGHAESVAIHAVAALYQRYGGRVIIGPLTTGEGVALARQYGIPAFTGVSYAVASAGRLLSYDPFWKVHPPLRSETDCESLRRALREYQIFIAAWDLYPLPESKLREWASASTGHATLEVMASLLWETLHRDHPEEWGLSQLVWLLAGASRQLLGLPSLTLEKGQPLDLTVFRLHADSRPLPAPWQDFASSLEVLGTIRCSADAHNLHTRMS